MRDLLASASVESLFTTRRHASASPPQLEPAPLPEATLVDVLLPCSLQALAATLYAPQSPYQASWAASLRARDVVETPWQLELRDGRRIAERLVSLSTPAPGAWASVVGSLPIASTRHQAITVYQEDCQLLMLETTRLSIPCGSMFSVRLQYWLAALATDSCRLRVSYEVCFSGPLGLMKPLLSHMLLSEHRAVFDAWAPFLLAAVRNGGGAPAADYQAADVARPPAPRRRESPAPLSFYASAAAACILLYAAALGAVALLLELLADVPWARHVARVAEAAAAGRHPAGSQVVALGRAIKAARLTPLPLLLAIALLLGLASLAGKSARRLNPRLKATRLRG